MNWGDLAKTVGEHAEGLGRLLLGPVGGAVGGVIATALGVEDKPDAVAAALEAHPEQLVELQRIEAEHLEALEKLRNERVAQRVANTVSARDHDIQMAKATGKRSFMRATLAIIATLGFFVMVGALFFVEIREANEAAAQILLGIAGTGWATVIGFYFGSSDNGGAVATDGGGSR